MKGRQYKVYTVLDAGGKVLESMDDYENVLWILSTAVGWDNEKAAQIMAECERTGRRLIFAYENSEEDQSHWESLGAIMDGGAYLG